MLAGAFGAAKPVAETEPTAKPIPQEPPPATPKLDTPEPSESVPSILHYLAGLIAILSLAACLVLPLGIFVRDSSTYGDYVDWYKMILPWITLTYFVSGLIWIQRRKPD